MEPGSTSVTIFGQEYTIRGGGEPEYVHRIAKFVDERMREVSSSTSQITSLRVAILAALNIADELLQEREGRRRTHDELRARAERLLANLEQAEG
jgi:cell division protein ZapA